MAAETIFALATGAGRSAIAVVRVSGPGALNALIALTGLQPQPRTAHYARFRDPRSGETIDRGLALWFPGPNSATGEDCAELHLHGGKAVVDALLSALGGQTGLRAAEPGEFARRAFSNGKLDLSQIEALADLIDAQTAFQRRQALRIAGGELKRRVETWRAAIVDSMALLAAELDFSDEGDVGTFSWDDLFDSIEPVRDAMKDALRLAPASERLRDGFLTLILGPPNAGKSSLMNSIAQREIAIVSDQPGTTRDLIEANLDLGGLPVTLVDTAGLREGGDSVERIGVSRARARAEEADLVLWLSEGGSVQPTNEIPAHVEFLHVATKCDLLPPRPDCLAVSAQSGIGIDELCQEISRRAMSALGDGGSALIIRARHRLAISEAIDFLGAVLEPGKPLELSAEDLRMAGRSLEAITGVIDVEQVLDAIFSRLCIGK